MFIDKIDIKIKSGKGGDGCVSFRRAKFVTNGGPDGGDGGRGGSIIFKADANKTTLLDFRYKRVFAAEPGENGAKRNCAGRAADDVTVLVPVGTVIREAKTGRIIADMAVGGVSRPILRGGRGGRGNQHFATAVRQAPRYAEKGGTARELDVTLELKLIADVGIIGFPNVGKSTILSMATNANPKIADYHFTTLSPNLGVVRDNLGEDFVLADIPGLVEGAGEGAGLGHEFLRHIERTKALVHVVDAGAAEREDPLADIETINAEMRKYSPALLSRPVVIACNKMDVPGAGENYERIKAAYEPKGVKVFPLTAAANDGVGALIKHAGELARRTPDPVVFTEEDIHFEEPPENRHSFTITETQSGAFVVEGVGVEKMLGYTNIDTEKGFAFFQKYLKDKGVNDALEAAGVKEGDSVRIAGTWFEYIP
jgi:GTP-binding protein